MRRKKTMARWRLNQIATSMESPEVHWFKKLESSCSKMRRMTLQRRLRMLAQKSK